MPEVLPCSNCGKRIKIPVQKLGKTVKCPACQSAFVAAEPLPDDDPRPPAPKLKPLSASAAPLPDIGNAFDFDEEPELPNTRVAKNKAAERDRNAKVPLSQLIAMIIAIVPPLVYMAIPSTKKGGFDWTQVAISGLLGGIGGGVGYGIGKLIEIARSESVEEDDA